MRVVHCLDINGKEFSGGFSSFILIFDILTALLIQILSPKLLLLLLSTQRSNDVVVLHDFIFFFSAIGCSNCPSNSKCVYGICVCLPGFFFDGKNCAGMFLRMPFLLISIGNEILNL